MHFMNSLNFNPENLIKLLKKQDASAQKFFYHQNAGRFLSVCRMYIRETMAAEDCLMHAFYKIFKNIGSYKETGKLENWARRIVINECLNYLKKHKTIFYLDENIPEIPEEIEDTEVNEELDVQELLDELPTNFKLVFNLYVMENYSHKQISETLNISVSSSKTQLFRAKEKLRFLFEQKKAKRHETL